MPRPRRSAPAILLFLACTSASAGVLLEPAPAPAWDVGEWINGTIGTLAEQQGKIVVIEFFQMWCPVCNDFSMPLMKRWDKRYGDRPDFLLVSIHTVFEGFEEQTPERLRSFVVEKQFLHPVGIDRDDPASPYPMTMQRFDTGGTPHIAIVDRQGLLRFSHFGYFDPEPVEAFLDRLADEKEPKAGKSKSSSTESSRPPSLLPGRGPRKPRRAPPTPGPAEPIIPQRIEEPESDEPIVPERAADEGLQPPEDPAVEAEPPTEGLDAGAGEQEAQQVQETEEEQSDPAGDAAVDEEEQEETEQVEEPKDPIAELNGSYRLRIEQSSRSCGDVAPPQELIAQITISGSQIEAGFSRAHLGMRRLSGTFDPGAMRFSALLDQQANYGAAVLQVHVEASGRFFEGPSGPELEFEYRYTQGGETPGANCEVAGHGTGASVRRR